MKNSRLMQVVGLAALLCGCGLAPIDDDQAVTLGPDQGIAAVVLDALNPISQFTIESTDPKGATIKVPSAPIGVSLYLFVVPAGRYCVSRYSVGMTNIRTDSPGHGDCFDVVAGKIAYSGNLAPRAFNSGGTWVRNELVGYDIRTLQNFEWPQFEKKLRDEHPVLAAKYPIAR